MSSGIFCTGNPLARSSSCHNRCWGESGGSGRCMGEFWATSDRDTGTGLCRRTGWCWGLGRHRRTGWTWGLGLGWYSDLKEGSGLQDKLHPSPHCALKCHGCCCLERTSSPSARGGGCANLAGYPERLVCLGSGGTFGGAGHSTDTVMRWVCNRHG